MSTTFYDEIQKWDWDTVAKSIYAKTETDVRQALDKAKSGKKITNDDFMALISPAADSSLEEMATTSQAITRRRFGNTMNIYTPLYLSNYCSNRCVYCGFNQVNKIKRVVLSPEQIEEECLAIRKHPFESILLVTGEAENKAGTKYMGKAIKQIKKHFNQVSMEIQPLSAEDYAYLMTCGLYSVSVYQETYRESTYGSYHPFGAKSNYRFRLETGDRLGSVGMYKIGIGALLGLEDWRVDTFFTYLHLRYMENKYWKTKYSISFPRLRPHEGEGFQPNYSLNERNLLQLMCAYRLASEDVEISLSTRESPYFRDHVMPICVTSLSAGSKTAPGGYSDYKKNKELEQFAVNDERNTDDTVAAVRERGLEPVWKDWSLYLQGSELQKGATK